MNVNFYMNKVRKGARNINRWSMEAVIKKQNLADHGYNVANIYAIACNSRKLKFTAEMLLLVMNHDALETLTGDLNKAVKDKNERTKLAWSVIEDEARLQIPGSGKYRNNRLSALLGETYNCFLFADYMDAYLYCLDERRLGNMNLSSPSSYYRVKLDNLDKDLFSFFKEAMDGS